MRGLPIGDFEVVAEAPLGAHLQMALDETLLAAVASGERPPLLRFWGWTERALVLGSNQSVANEIDAAAARRLGFTITRRLSGGGTMIAEPGRTITWSAVFPAERVAGLNFRESFAALDRWAVEALRGLGIDAGYRPINDIVSPTGKIAGAAQARRAGAVLHHVTMAYSMDGGLLTEVLRLGLPALEERGVRSADKRVSALDSLTGASREAVVEALIAGAGGRPGVVRPDEIEAAKLLAASKYSLASWIHRLP